MSSIVPLPRQREIARLVRRGMVRPYTRDGARKLLWANWAATAVALIGVTVSFVPLVAAGATAIGAVGAYLCLTWTRQLKVTTKLMALEGAELVEAATQIVASPYRGLDRFDHPSASWVVTRSATASTSQRAPWCYRGEVLRSCMHHEVFPDEGDLRDLLDRFDDPFFDETYRAVASTANLGGDHRNEYPAALLSRRIVELTVDPDVKAIYDGLLVDHPSEHEWCVEAAVLLAAQPAAEDGPAAAS